jgi:hypothetical protein
LKDLQRKLGKNKNKIVFSHYFSIGSLSKMSELKYLSGGQNKNKNLFSHYFSIGSWVGELKYLSGGQNKN